MRGIILAGGHGTRLQPLTISASKQLLPLYDKPMIYYPLSVLMLAGIREILLICTPDHLPAFRRLLADGRQWGLEFSYAEQTEPRGLADAFIVGRDFVNAEPTCLILGDNIFFGHGLPDKLRSAAKLETGALIFAYAVRDPERYGVVEFDDKGQPAAIVEKPTKVRSRYAIPGLYFYDGKVVDFAESLVPSKRGELEITDLHRLYLDRGELRVELLGRGMAWLDTGTHESLMQAASFVQAVQERQGLMISCPEEIAYRMGYISADQLHELAEVMGNNEYQSYLLGLVREDPFAEGTQPKI